MDALFDAFWYTVLLLETLVATTMPPRAVTSAAMSMVGARMLRLPPGASVSGAAMVAVSFASRINPPNPKDDKAVASSLVVPIKPAAMASPGPT